MNHDSVRPTPPAVFAVTIVPFAAAIGYVSIAAPFWLKSQGVSLAVIGAISATTMTPHAIKFLWAPLVDIGSYRKVWFVGMTLACAALLGALALVPDLARHLGLFTAVATAAQVAGTTACVAADGLMAATTRLEDKGKAGGWRMAGNVGGTGVLGALALWVASRASVPAAGAVMAAVTAASAFAALLIVEPHFRDPAVERAGSFGRALWVRVRGILDDLWGTVRSRDGWTGLVICALPVGAGALTNLFSAMAVDYGASEHVVAVVSGLGGGLVGAVGSLVGGYLADHMNRRLAYALSAGITALSAVAMLAAPLTPLTYAWGTLAYNFANGIAFATLAAFILEMVGHSAAAATKYTLFIAIANVASNYVTALDGWGSELRGLGARGALIADAVLTFAGIGVLLGMVALTRRSGSGAAASG
ncbi:MFS transporter [Anaeromyxobacter paludicola]|uniref:Integral membrane signal transducer protein n=1 Tax=Anaeromyxobacter paludicola TaxID=2918171 RepID=A0ABM7X7V8_9BACT|nr:MFS transporter [Anaeromyxobacter paludicola]BDG07928.1 integral membrane signal transducer protein [Anaeromyxobacter paludicola]